MSPLHYEMLRSGRNGVNVIETSCQITREQRARRLFRRQHNGEHCTFKLYTAQIRCVEFGYLDNRRNVMVVLEDTVLRLRHEWDTFRTNQEKTHLFFCTACCQRLQVSCDNVTLQ